MPSALPSISETGAANKANPRIGFNSSRPMIFSLNSITSFALVYGDDNSDDYYIFLVPDEGFSSISLLHDALYSGFMRPHLRLDLPYIPHIGIATNKDKEHLYQLARGWNRQALVIRGTINSLTLSSYSGKKIEEIKEFILNQSEQGNGGNSALLRPSP